MTHRSLIDRRRALWICAAGSIAVSGCGSDAPLNKSDQTPKVLLQLNWFPDAQHGGFYAAQVHGIFAAEGLDVTIVSGGPNVPVIQSVASRRVTFAIGNADQVLIGREQGADVVAVFAAMQDSPRCILVREDSGIESFADLNNITLSLGSGKSFAKYLQSQLPLSHVRIVPYSGNIAALLKNKNYAQQGYVFSEPLVARRQGVRVRSLMVSDLGFNPYTSLLLTHAALISEEPALVEKMVRAVRQGWQRYLETPDETNREIHRQNPEIDLESLRFGTQAIRSLCLPTSMPTGDLGVMAADRWQTLARQLADLKLIGTSLDPQAAFTNRFLPAESNRQTATPIRAAESRAVASRLPDRDWSPLGTDR